VDFRYLARGDCVKVLDYVPNRPVVSAQGHEDSYIVGIIRDAKMIEDEGRHYRAYTVECMYDSEWCYKNGELVSRVGSKVHVPIEISLDYPGRIRRV
jgi:hypothetical protein